MSINSCYLFTFLLIFEELCYDFDHDTLVHDKGTKYVILW
jgi:hypothetical protein